ncbi:hypothetical protein QYE76_060980 [Lolium multiflorum]|uniref:Uncharacterized protein n=1 Tax=Lolium multiflorum TaxID=4521 RepID=A0AAD8W5Y0_LOLMU|nr:hypothetical protein QYE76_060980 [Lolium multiflorum]
MKQPIRRRRTNSEQSRETLPKNLIAASRCRDLNGRGFGGLLSRTAVAGMGKTRVAQQRNVRETKHSVYDSGSDPSLEERKRDEKSPRNGFFQWSAIGIGEVERRSPEKGIACGLPGLQSA